MSNYAPYYSRISKCQVCSTDFPKDGYAYAGQHICLKDNCETPVMCQSCFKAHNCQKDVHPYYDKTPFVSGFVFEENKK